MKIGFCNLKSPSCHLHFSNQCRFPLPTRSRICITSQKTLTCQSNINKHTHTNNVECIVYHQTDPHSQSHFSLSLLTSHSWAQLNPQRSTISMTCSVIERRNQQPLRLTLLRPNHHRTTNLHSPLSSETSSSSGFSPYPITMDLEKLSVIGQGNGGTVYKVSHKQTGEIYALKLVRCGEHEAEIMQRVDSSEHVVRCHGVVSDGGGLLMEYMDGGSLHDMLLDKKRLPERIISTVLKSVLRGLRYLHGLRVVHGDIKPSNILLNMRGEVKIADFGASRVVAGVGVGAGGDVITCAGEDGTCAYMSPERMDPERWWGGEQCEGYAGDVWALGVVAMECLLGRFPFIGPGQNLDWVTLMCTVCAQEEDVEKVVNRGSPEFESFCRQCLVRDWRKRGTVEELLMHPFVHKFEVNGMQQETYQFH